MVTKTRAKPTPDLGVAPVQLTSFSRETIAETLNIDAMTQKTLFEGAVAAIEDCLKHSKHRLVSISDRPLAPHLIAELRPIEAAAGDLVGHLNASKLSVAVIRELRSSHEEVYAIQQLVSGLQGSAKSAIERLETIKTAGEPVKEFGEILEEARIILGSLFESLCQTPDEEDPTARAADKKEFLEICRGYLPVAPTQRKEPSA